MDKRVLEVNSEGQESAIHVEEGRIVFTEKQDVTSLLDQNKAEQNQHRAHGDMVRVASIDLVTYNRLVREGITKDKKRFMKWLEDPDNSLFRTNNMGLTKTATKKFDPRIIVK